MSGNGSHDNTQGSNRNGATQIIFVCISCGAQGTYRGSIDDVIITGKHATHPIKPFQGRINGVLSQDVERWISEVEQYLIRNHTTNGYLALLEGRKYIDFQKGDISHWTRTQDFHKCRTWEDLKTFLRRIYGYTGNASRSYNSCNIWYNCETRGHLISVCTSRSCSYHRSESRN